MPELPEVETIKRDLEKKILNQNIVRVFIHDGRVIRNSSHRSFIKNLTGKTFAEISRRGKALIFKFRGSGYLVVQLMMTGQLIYSTKTPSNKNSPLKVSFHLSNNSYLNYNDQRLFGRLYFVQNLNEVKFFQAIGPDPLTADFDIHWLKEALARRKMPIKPLLMNQNFLAGIGNIYASEILFAAGIHPQRAAKTLNQKETHSLHAKIKEILNEAIRLRGTSMNNYRDASGQKGNYMNRIKVYGREGDPCLVCQSLVERFAQGGRSTFFCRRCQK